MVDSGNVNQSYLVLKGHRGNATLVITSHVLYIMYTYTVHVHLHVVHLNVHEVQLNVHEVH